MKFITIPLYDRYNAISEKAFNINYILTVNQTGTDVWVKVLENHPSKPDLCISYRAAVPLQELMANLNA